MRTNEEETNAKQRWEPMRLSSVGHVSQVVKGGGGKTSPSPADPGEIRKPKGNANE